MILSMCYQGVLHMQRWVGRCLMQRLSTLDMRYNNCILLDPCQQGSLLHGACLGIPAELGVLIFTKREKLTLPA